MDTRRKLAIAAGVCYLITHVTSVPAAFLYGPILNRAGYVLGSVPDTRVVGEVLRRCPENWSRCSSGGEEVADWLERDAVRAWAKPPRRRLVVARH